MSAGKALRPLGVLATFLIAACSSNQGDGSTAGDSKNFTKTDGGSGVDLDFALPRLCTVSAYESRVEPSRFAVGDYAVAKITDTTPSALPLSKFVMLSSEGQPSEARFGIYFRRAGAQHTNLLTPYSPLPLASRDSTSMTFKTPSETDDDISTLKLSAPNGPSAAVTLEFIERVHGNPSRSMTIECVSGS